jgi:hypothetical protein
VTFTDTYLLQASFTIDAGCHRYGRNTIDIVNNLLTSRRSNGPEGDDRYEWPGVRGYVRPASVWHGHDIQVSGPRRESHG